MNCPGHVPAVQDSADATASCRSAFSEHGLVHRHERSGTLHGLFRVRHFTQDDAHVFCTDEQIEDEIVGCLDFGFDDLQAVRLRAKLELSTRPEKRSAPTRSGTTPRRR